MTQITLPHTPEGERAIIGAVLRGDVRPDELGLADSDFYVEAHQRIWMAIGQDRDPDLFIVVERLRDAKALDKVGGEDYLRSLWADTGGVQDMQRVAQRMREMSGRRRLITAAQRIARDAYNLEKAYTECLTGAEREFIRAVSSAPLDRTVPIQDVVDRAMRRLEDIRNGNADAIGVPIGLRDLDALLRGGAKPGELVVVAARPSVGKSSFLMGLVLHNSIRPPRNQRPRPGVVYTLEMSDESLVIRLQSALTGVDSRRLSVASLEPGEWEAVSMAARDLAHRPIWMNDAPMSIAEIAIDARRLKAVHGIEYVVIDFLGLVAAPGRSDYERVSAAALGAQAIAKELRVPVFLACQLSRDAATGRPALSHLRDSGRIEEAADVVIMLHREEMINPNTPLKNVAEALVHKNRNGATGKVDLFFDKQVTAFRDLAKE